MIPPSPRPTCDDDVLVRVEGVGKKFCRDLKKSLWYGMKDIAAELLPGERDLERHATLRPDEFWAVDDVSFELRRGECLGLIGRNGAGKTTLLKMLNGLIKPDKGRIEMRGRVGALIALGAGFNPILTGRENIYVNGSVLGLRKAEIDAKLEEIVEFAELGDFIDAPVQSYSSGMSVRLGFAVATTLDPDVLILDEVLAVGDAGFRHKCYHRINGLMSPAAVVLVSHSMDHIAHTSTRVAMLRQGVAEFFETPADGIAAYSSEMVTGCDGNDGGRIEEVYTPIRRAQVHLPAAPAQYGRPFLVEVDIESDTEISDAIFSFTAVNPAEQPVMCWHTSRHPGRLALRKGLQRLRIEIDPLLLHDGEYHWNFNATRRGSIEHFIWFMRAGHFQVVSDYRPIGNIPYLADTSKAELVTLEPPPAVADHDGFETAVDLGYRKLSR